MTRASKEIRRVLDRFALASRAPLPVSARTAIARAERSLKARDHASTSRDVSLSAVAPHRATCERQKPACYMQREHMEARMHTVLDDIDSRDVASLADAELLASLRRLLADERTLSARMLVHLGEVDASVVSDDARDIVRLT